MTLLTLLAIAALHADGLTLIDCPKPPPDDLTRLHPQAQKVWKEYIARYKIFIDLSRAAEQANDASTIKTLSSIGKSRAWSEVASMSPHKVKGGLDLLDKQINKVRFASGVVHPCATPFATVAIHPPKTHLEEQHRQNERFFRSVNKTIKVDKFLKRLIRNTIQQQRDIEIRARIQGEDWAIRSPL